MIRERESESKIRQWKGVVCDNRQEEKEGTTKKNAERKS
jgi:hypothetical protein